MKHQLSTPSISRQLSQEPKKKKRPNLFVESATRLYIGLSVELIGLEDAEAFLELRAVLFDRRASGPSRLHGSHSRIGSDQASK